MDITRQYVKKFISESATKNEDASKSYKLSGTSSVEGEISIYKYNGEDGETYDIFGTLGAARMDTDDLTKEEVNPAIKKWLDHLSGSIDNIQVDGQPYQQALSESAKNESVTYDLLDFRGDVMDSGLTEDEVITFAKDFQKDPNAEEYAMEINNIDDALEYCDAAGIKVVKSGSEVNEGTIDNRGIIDFDTLGGSVDIYIGPEYDFDRDESAFRVGFNSSSRGAINFYAKLPAEININDGKAQYQYEKELREKVTAFAKKCVDEYDAKIEAFMKELGFEKR